MSCGFPPLPPRQSGRETEGEACFTFKEGKCAAMGAKGMQDTPRTPPFPLSKSHGFTPISSDDGRLLSESQFSLCVLIRGAEMRMLQSLIFSLTHVCSFPTFTAPSASHLAVSSTGDKQRITHFVGGFIQCSISIHAALSAQWQYR